MHALAKASPTPSSRLDCRPHSRTHCFRFCNLRRIECLQYIIRDATTTWNDLDTVAFLAYAYLPLLPFAIIGVRIAKTLEMALWSLLCIVGTFVSSIPAMGMQALGYRWALLLTVPLCIYSAVGLSRIARVHATNRRLLQLLQDRKSV